MAIRISKTNNNYLLVLNFVSIMFRREFKYSTCVIIYKLFNFIAHAYGKIE